MNQVSAPNTIHADLVKSLNGLINEGYLLQRTDLRWKRLEREASQLMKADAWLGWITVADLCCLVGDLDEMDASFGRASRIRHDNLLYEHWATCNLNVGRVLEAQTILSQTCSPRDGHFSSKIPLLNGSGAFHLLKASYEEAAAIGLEDLAAYSDDIDHTNAIVSMLDEAGLTDADVGRALGITIRALVHRGNFAMGLPLISVADESGIFRGASIMLQTSLSGSEFLDLVQEIVLAEESDQELRKHPNFEVGLLPASGLAEHAVA